jgi:hypothetical protein
LIRWLKNKADFLAKSEAWEHSQQIEQKSKAPKLSNESLNSGHQNLDEIERLSQIAKMSSSLAQHGNQQRCTRNETKKKILATALGTRRGNQNQKQWKEIELGTWTAEKTSGRANCFMGWRPGREQRPSRNSAGQKLRATLSGRGTAPRDLAEEIFWHGTVTGRKLRAQTEDKQCKSQGRAEEKHEFARSKIWGGKTRSRAREREPVESFPRRAPDDAREQEQKAAAKIQDEAKLALAQKNRSSMKQITQIQSENEEENQTTHDVK